MKIKCLKTWELRRYPGYHSEYTVIGYIVAETSRSALREFSRRVEFIRANLNVTHSIKFGIQRIF